MIQPSEKAVFMACSARQAEEPSRADQLYVGPAWFVWRAALRTLPPQAAPKLLILSAKYGVLEPSEIVDPYDVELDIERAHAIAADRGNRGKASLLLRRKPPTRVIFLGGGKAYRDLMRAVLTEAGYTGDITAPTDTRGIGDNLRSLRAFLLD